MQGLNYKDIIQQLNKANIEPRHKNAIEIIIMALQNNTRISWLDDVLAKTGEPCFDTIINYYNINI